MEQQNLVETWSQLAEQSQRVVQAFAEARWPEANTARPASSWISGLVDAALAQAEAFAVHLEDVHVVGQTASIWKLHSAGLAFTIERPNGKSRFIRRGESQWMTA